MSLTANAQGIVTGRFTVPANIPAGTKRVEFQGATTTASATFVGRGMVTTRELQQVTRVTTSWAFVEPLAQTFSLPAADLIVGIDLWFCAKGSSAVIAQLRECQLGIPSNIILAEARLEPADIITTGAETPFRWSPVLCNADTEYAVVLMCDDAQASVRVAELGQYDATLQRWVTSQPYVIGVLLSSSNARTWTPHQTKDLKFRLVGNSYSPTTRTLSLGTVAVTAADYLLVLAAVERPTNETNVTFTLDLDGDLYTVVENQPLLLPAPYTGDVIWSAVLTGTANISPVLYPTVQLVWAPGLTTGTYITRAIPAGTNSKVYVNLLGTLPGSSTITVEAQSGPSSWTSVPLDEAIDVGNGWTDRRYYLADLDVVETRIRLTLAGTAQERPGVKDLQVIITE